MFLYFNATLLEPLLIPLLEQQDNPDQFPYASKDLGMCHCFVMKLLPVFMHPLGTAFPTVLSPTLLASEAIERKFHPQTELRLAFVNVEAPSIRDS